MYKIESFEDGRALVVNTELLYENYWLSDSREAAEQLVIGLNQPDLLEALARHRFQFEENGLTLADGLRVLTDRESQSQLNSAYTNLKYSLIPDTDWKAANGWQVGTLEQIEPIVKAVAAHVRGCFRGERTVGAAINESTTMEQIESIDIPSQFAAAYQAAFSEVMTPEQAAE